MCWYLITVKFLKLFCYFTIIKYCCYFDSLSLIEKIFCYFCFDYIPQGYNISSVKLFLNNKKFRIITKNILIVLKDILFKLYFPVFFKFCIFFILPWYFMYFLLSNTTYKITTSSIRIIFFTFYTLLIFFLKIFSVFNLLNFNYSIHSIMLNFFLINVYYYIYKNICNFNLKLKQYNKLKFFVTKILCYFFILIVVLFLLLNLLNEPTNHFLQEYLVKFLMVYTYIYYKF